VFTPEIGVGLRVDGIVVFPEISDQISPKRLLIRSLDV